MYMAGIIEHAFLSVFQRYRVHYAFTLHVLESLAYNLLRRRIYHYRDGCCNRIGSYRIKKTRHFGRRVKHTVVKVDIKNICPGQYLATGYFYGLVRIVFFYEPEEFSRTGYIASLSHACQFVPVGIYRHWFEAAQ